MNFYIAFVHIMTSQKSQESSDIQTALIRGVERISLASDEPADRWSHIKCPEGVIAGRSITKDVRDGMFGGSVSGGAAARKPENYQLSVIRKGTDSACLTTPMRINLYTKTMQRISHPNKAKDGFNYSENFDAEQTFGDMTIYINLKCIVGKGGSQTRSLREVHRFVEGQLHVLLTKKNICFANVLDGDESHANMDKFDDVVCRPEFGSVRSKIYVGDLKGYFDWLRHLLESDPQ